MISDNQMDQIFRERLGSYSSSVPEDMWRRIMEKKKRDKMLWLFFFRIMIITFSVFGLTGSYLIFNQKKISTTTNTGVIQKRQPLDIKITAKTNTSVSSYAEDHGTVPEKSAVGKNGKQKRNAAVNYFDVKDHSKKNFVHNEVPSQTEYSSAGIETHNESTAPDTASIENVKKKDSLDKKPLIKTTLSDSSQHTEVKKSEKQNKQNNKWYLDLYASPDYPIVTPNPYDHIVYKLSYTIGVKINRTLGKHFSVKTGIQYSQINISGYDSGATNLKRLDLPVLAGYSFQGAHIRTTVNGGAIFNLYSWAPAQDYFEKNLGVSLYLGINFERKIKEKLALFIEPYYRYQLSSMTINSVQSVKFIDIVGISFGARYFFKK